jgi:hypothetical protein
MLRPGDRLAARLELLSAPRDPEYMSPGFIDKLPPEGNNPKHEYLVRCSYFFMLLQFYWWCSTIWTTCRCALQAEFAVDGGDCWKPG